MLILQKNLQNNNILSLYLNCSILKIAIALMIEIEHRQVLKDSRLGTSPSLSLVPLTFSIPTFDKDFHCTNIFNGIVIIQFQEPSLLEFPVFIGPNSRWVHFTV